RSGITVHWPPESHLNDPNSPSNFHLNQDELDALLAYVHEPSTDPSQPGVPDAGRIDTFPQFYNIESPTSRTRAVGSLSSSFQPHPNIFSGYKWTDHDSGASRALADQVMPSDRPVVSDPDLKRQRVNVVAQSLRRIREQRQPNQETQDPFIKAFAQINPAARAESSLHHLQPVSIPLDPDGVSGPISGLSRDEEGGRGCEPRFTQTRLLNDQDDCSLEPVDDTDSDIAPRAGTSKSSSQPEAAKGKLPRSTYARGVRKHLVARIEPEELKKLDWTYSPFSRSKEDPAVYERKTMQHVNDQINDKIFDKKLKWVSTDNLKPWQWQTFTTAALEQTRTLPLPSFTPIELGKGRGVIREVRMSVHGGVRGRFIWPENHPLTGNPDFMNFWGIPEGRELRSAKIVHYYGTGYLDRFDFPAVNEKIKEAKKDIAQGIDGKAREVIEKTARETSRIHG
ncbi:related to effector family protein Eff1 (C-terminal fragment), partial [Sporisorium reilianum f. sp. reilianum]